MCYVFIHLRTSCGIVPVSVLPISVDEHTYMYLQMYIVHCTLVRNTAQALSYSEYGPIRVYVYLDIFAIFYQCLPPQSTYIGRDETGSVYLPTRVQ